jgi:hypothetical protein
VTLEDSSTYNGGDRAHGALSDRRGTPEIVLQPVADLLSPGPFAWEDSELDEIDGLATTDGRYRSSPTWVHVISRIVASYVHSTGLYESVKTEGPSVKAAAMVAASNLSFKKSEDDVPPKEKSLDDLSALIDELVSPETGPPTDETSLRPPRCEPPRHDRRGAPSRGERCKGQARAHPARRRGFHEHRARKVEKALPEGSNLRHRPRR